jgi:hypothetical protein
MAGGGISPSGRALRFLLWRAPVRAASYTAAGFVATTTEVGRRWITIAGLGLWVWFLRWLAVRSGVVGFRQVTAFLLLLWFWRLFVLVRWTIGLRVAAARARAMQREIYQTVTEKLPNQMQQWGRQAAAQIPGGTFTMRGSMRHDDPAADEHARMAREQAEESRGWLPEEHRDMPLGDRFEPVFRLPKWLRRGPK